MAKTYKPAAVKAITSAGTKFIIGMLRPGEHGEEATGTINGTNKKFITQYPIFPASKLSIAPQPGDVKAYLLKGTTYTEATVTAISTTIDPDTDIEYFGEVELTTAPTTETADKVFILYHGELTPFKLQSASDDASRDSSEVTEVGSEFKETTTGAKSRTIDIEYILANLDTVQELGFEEYNGSGTVQEGYQAFDEKEGLTDVLLYVNMQNPSKVFVGRFYYEGRLDVQQLHNISTGDNPTGTMQVLVDGAARMIKPEAA